MNFNSDIINKDFFVASMHPESDINFVAYNGQNPRLKQYRKGYDNFFNAMPKLRSDDSQLPEKFEMTQEVLRELSTQINTDSWFWLKENIPFPQEFRRTIIALESPIVDQLGTLHEGAELVVASWGDGFTSPVHGHSTGYMHEEVLSGKIMVNMFRMTAPDSKVVRPVRSDIRETGIFVSEFNAPSQDHFFKRQTLIHNFKSIGHTVSLHYLPEHTRDGRDNTFEVERFGDSFQTSYLVAHKSQLVFYTTQLSTEEALDELKIGDVAIVRSSNVPEHGDHYIVITGNKIQKPHGFRFEEVSIDAPDAKEMLDLYEPINGVTILKLAGTVRDQFFEFHGITMKNNVVIFPSY